MGRLAYKSSTKFSSAQMQARNSFSSAAKLGPTTGTGNEKQRIFRKFSAWHGLRHYEMN